MKKWIWAVSGFIIIFTLFYFLRNNNNADSVKEFKTDVIKRGDLRLTVGAAGTVTPYVEVEVKSKAGGEIISFSFQEGHRLRKGDVVVRLDPETEQSRVNQARADLLIAEAGLEKAKITLKDEELTLKRQKSLFEDRVISRQDLDNAILAAEKAGSDVKIAEAGLIRAKETLKEAEDRLQDTEIRAPLSGTILVKYVEEGQVIASTTSSASEGTLLFTMADLERIYIEALVDETDIGKVRPEQVVDVTVDAYPEKIFRGRVVRIAPRGMIESTITVFKVIVEIEDRDRSMLKPMMTANVEIITELRKNVLLAPSESVRARGDETGIYKLVHESPKWTPVKTGSSNSIATEIEGDVREGEKVVISGIDNKEQVSDRSRDVRRGFRFFGRKK